DGIRDFHVTGVQTCALPISFYEERRESLDGVERRLTHDDLNLANLLLQKRGDGWHFVAFLDFERARGRDPLIDLVRLESWTLPRSEERRVGKECRWRWATGG